MVFPRRKTGSHSDKGNKTAGNDQSKIPRRPIVSIKIIATIDPKKFAPAIGSEATMV